MLLQQGGGLLLAGFSLVRTKPTRHATRRHDEHYGPRPSNAFIAYDENMNSMRRAGRAIQGSVIRQTRQPIILRWRWRLVRQRRQLGRRPHERVPVEAELALSSSPGGDYFQAQPVALPQSSHPSFTRPALGRGDTLDHAERCARCAASSNCSTTCLTMHISRPC